MPRDIVVNARVTADEKTYLQKKFGSITNAIRFLLTPRADGITAEFGERNWTDEPMVNTDGYPWDKRAIVLTPTRHVFDLWCEDQKTRRQRGETWFNPNRAIHVYRIDQLRGLDVCPGQVIKAAGSQFLPREIFDYLDFLYAVNKDREAKA